MLAIAGGRGKTGAAAMTGMAALRAGAGLVTVASAESAIPQIAAYAPELMTLPLDETEEGAITSMAFSAIREALEKKTVAAIGPGLGTYRLTVDLVRRVFDEIAIPLVVDADGLNALAGSQFRGGRVVARSDAASRRDGPPGGHLHRRRCSRTAWAWRGDSRRNATWCWC